MPPTPRPPTAQHQPRTGHSPRPRSSTRHYRPRGRKGPGHRQRRRHHPGSRRRGRQPPGRSPACASDQPDRAARRPHAPFGHRRPRVRRTRHRARTAGPRGTYSCHPAQSQTLSRPPRRRACPRLPYPRQVANRLRRPDQLPQARIRLGPHPARRPRRSFHLVRARGIHPQPGQDQRPCQLTLAGRTRECRQHPPPEISLRTFSGRSN